MSYLVLARKHRPATFGEVVGQEHVTKTLVGALTSGRLAHAFCFTGPRGVGKTSVARILAKALNCSQGPTPEPCTDCPQCREIDEGRSLDVQEIDAASNSRVEDVRELREMIRYRPQASRFRVTILDEVHMLSKAAFNALLKTLEEPPEHAVFILATTDVHKVPLTILSRCQRYDFRRLAPKVLAEHLARVLEKEDCRLPPESLALMAREADGSVRDALSLLDQVLSLGRGEMTHQEVVELLGLVDREMVAATARAVLAGQAARVLELVEGVYAAGGEMQAFYAALQEHFRNLAAARSLEPGSEIFGLSQEELAELAREARRVSPETLHEIFEHLARAEELFRRASQPRLVMEMTLLKLTQVRPVLSLEEIIARLEAAAGGQGKDGAAPAPPPASPVPAPDREDEPPAAGATSPPSPAGGRVAPAEAGAALAELARYAARSEPTLAGYLGRARAEAAAGELRIILPPSPLARGLCTPENQDKLGALAAELWRDAPRLTLEVAEESEPRSEQPAKVEQAQALARHPAVLEAVEVFEAQVVSLNPAPPEK